MQSDERTISRTNATRIDQMILKAILDVNGSRRPQATPSLIVELLGPRGRSANPPVRIPLPEPDSVIHLHPGLIHARIIHLIRAGFLETDRAGRIYLPEMRGRPL